MKVNVAFYLPDLPTGFSYEGSADRNSTLDSGQVGVWDDDTGNRIGVVQLASDIDALAVVRAELAKLGLEVQP